jgi:Glutathione S-transferase, N-terminal domain
LRRLLTIPISHFCEKARWALERADLDYVEERHVQGIHRVKARRAGGGATVPVLVTEEGVFAESEEILTPTSARRSSGACSRRTGGRAARSSRSAASSTRASGPTGGG